MKHFIITRFNYKKNYPHLAERLGLFFQLTRPSIKAQTNQNFEWLILCDYPPVAVIEATYLPPGTYKGTRLTGNYIEYMKEKTKDEDLVLMTRLDNDDILMPDFVDSVQNAAKNFGATNRLYEFWGYRLDLRTGKFYRDEWYHRKLTSPFLTLAQDPKKLKTVYCTNHSKMWKKFPLTVIPTRKWVQVIHDNNWLLNTGNEDYWDKRGTKCAVPPFVMKLING